MDDHPQLRRIQLAILTLSERDPDRLRPLHQDGADGQPRRASPGGAPGADRRMRQLEAGKVILLSPNAPLSVSRHPRRHHPDPGPKAAPHFSAGPAPYYCILDNNSTTE